MIHTLMREQYIPRMVADVWDYFCDPYNLNALTPPDMNFEIVHGGHVPMYAGQLIEYRVEFIRGVRSRWLTEIAHVQVQQYFVDEQRLGPYRFWYHEHVFEPAPARNGTRMIDRVTYAVPFGLIGDMLNTVWIRRRLEYIFNYRCTQINQLFGEAA
jgi:ligand-binding SRPBCC domain-containing protein